MTATQPDNTSVATRRTPEVQAKIDDAKARNTMVAAIRGTQWGNNLSSEVQRSIAEYARQNNLDPVRHIEILGGRIYLSADLYDEKGAHLIRSGQVVPDEPDFVHADKRLDTLAEKGEAWAVEESARRIKARIMYAIPEAATGAVIQRFNIPASGAVIVGVNWCGDRASDPVGKAEPAKTAQTRARRRAWKQIADVVPGYAEIVRPLEATARVINETLPVAVVENTKHATPALMAGNPDDPYADGPAAQGVVEEGELGL